jgi:hypothetical protein
MAAPSLAHATARRPFALWSSMADPLLFVGPLDSRVVLAVPVGAVIRLQRAGFEAGNDQKSLNPWASRRTFSIIRLMASVPPLLTPWMSK